MNDLAALDNPVRREFHLFLLLSGSRPDALKRAKIEHVDFRARLLHMPRPKGGEAKAFDIPLSRAMILCLVRVLRLGRMLYPTQSQNWIFPADSASGHLAEHKEGPPNIGEMGQRSATDVPYNCTSWQHCRARHSFAHESFGGGGQRRLHYSQQTAQQPSALAAGNNFPAHPQHCQIRTKGKTVASRMWFAQPSRRVLLNVLEAVAATPQGLDTSFSSARS